MLKIMNTSTENRDTSITERITRLLEIIDILRAPDGCPWDREQTPATVKKYILEECYELADAIDQDDPQEVCEELGDIFFMLLFIGRMYEENGDFEIARSLELIEEKMVRRHPHIFADVQVNSTADVTTNWQNIKAQEARDSGKKHSVLGNLPKALPALQRAFRVGERASRVNFDWKHTDELRDKLDEETTELWRAVQGGNVQEIEEELGDLLFTVSNLSRKLNINPEEALQKAVAKFTQRFHAMEKILEEQGTPLPGANMEDMDRAWEKVKKGNRQLT